MIAYRKLSITTLSAFVSNRSTPKISLIPHFRFSKDFMNLLLEYMVFTFLYSSGSRREKRLVDRRDLLHYIYTSLHVNRKFDNYMRTDLYFNCQSKRMTGEGTE